MGRLAEEQELSIEERRAARDIATLVEKIHDLFYYCDEVGKLPKATKGKLEVAFRTLKKVALLYSEDDSLFRYWSPLPGAPFKRPTEARK